MPEPLVERRRFLGPAALLQAWRWLDDSRDEATGERLDMLEDHVHSGARIWVLLAVRFLCFALAVTGILATLRVAFVWGAAG